jgi:hypothetical protein
MGTKSWGWEESLRALSRDGETRRFSMNTVHSDIFYNSMPSVAIRHTTHIRITFVTRMPMVQYLHAYNQFDLVKSSGESEIWKI